MSRVRGHVAIDGPAGSGKTTVARALARRLGYLYLDTGAMYRAVALLTLERGVDAGDAGAVAALAHERPISVVPDAAAPDGMRIEAGGVRLGNELYGNDVSRVVSIVAAHPAIREMMVGRQREIARSGPVVMAGRDIGTVVLPEADHKVFLTASLDARVGRRLAELRDRGVAVDEATLRREIQERDRLDVERSVAPLRPAEGACELDSSDLSVEDVVERIAALVTSA